VNREAELRAPSRVACSDLLGGVFISSALSFAYVIRRGEIKKRAGAEPEAYKTNQQQHLGERPIRETPKLNDHETGSEESWKEYKPDAK
jgi:hypothetical protein